MYAVGYTQRHYLGSSLSANRDFAILRTGRRDRYVLVDTALDFPVYHPRGHGLPVGFRVYRQKKGWLAGFFGWAWSGSSFSKTGWEEVTPVVEMKAEASSGLTYSSRDTSVTPSKSFIRDVASFWKEQEQEVNPNNFDAVTHISVHVPLTTKDG
jgi:hypothetical protein